MKRGRIGWRWWLAPWLLATLPGCGLGYLAHVSKGQLEILWNRKPIAEVLADPALDPKVRAKLELVARARDLARDIGLTPGDSYQTYVALDRPFTSIALSAAPKDRLVPYLWHFPIVGSVPYKGFFDRELAEEERASLAADGYDTYLREVDAYSTLGWFADPVLSPMLQRSEASLVDTIVHESTHATIFEKGNADFNEGLATFVGGEGAILYLARTKGPESAEAKALVARHADQERFTAFLKELFADLESYYGGPASPPEKIAGREARMAEWQARLRTADVGVFQRYAEVPWNNAFLLSLKLYLVDLGRFRRLHEGLGGDIAATIRFLKEDPSGDTASKRLDAWLASHPEPSASAPAPAPASPPLAPAAPADPAV